MTAAVSPASLPRADCVTVRGVGKTYVRGVDRVDALTDVSLTISQGSFVTLFGPSGCGKSSLLRIIAGLEQPSSGTVSIFGDPPAAASRRKEIGWIPQSAALLPWLTVLSNVSLSEAVNRRADRRTDRRASGPQQGSRQARDPRAVLEEVGLAGFAGARPDQLSGGMRQRAAIARGLVQGAPLMLMDEPFSAVDELTRETLRWQLLDLWRRHDKTIVFVTHSASEAVLLSDAVVVMTPRPGRVREVIEVTLPRPRTPEMTEGAAFTDCVSRVKRSLRDGWQGEAP